MDVDRSCVELQNLNKHTKEASPPSRQELLVWEGRQQVYGWLLRMGHLWDTWLKNTVAYF